MATEETKKLSRLEKVISYPIAFSLLVASVGLAICLGSVATDSLGLTNFAPRTKIERREIRGKPVSVYFSDNGPENRLAIVIKTKDEKYEIYGGGATMGAGVNANAIIQSEINDKDEEEAILECDYNKQTGEYRIRNVSANGLTVKLYE